MKQSEPLFGPGGVTEDLILRWVLFANYLKLLVPGRSAVVGFLFEPGDHIFVMIHINRHMVSLQQTLVENKNKKSEDVSRRGIHPDGVFGAQGLNGHLRDSGPIWSDRGCR